MGCIEEINNKNVTVGNIMNNPDQTQKMNQGYFYTLSALYK
jgi:hypothetical protein